MVHEVERRQQRELDPVFEAIRREVAAEHELPVEAIVLIKAGSIPKTSSGKIQRHACRQGFLDGTLEVIAEWRVWDAAAHGLPRRRLARAGSDPAATQPAPRSHRRQAWAERQRCTGRRRRLDRWKW